MHISPCLHLPGIPQRGTTTELSRFYSGTSLIGVQRGKRPFNRRRKQNWMLFPRTRNGTLQRTDQAPFGGTGNDSLGGVPPRGGVT